MKRIYKILLLIAITLGVSSYGSPVNKKVYEKKSNEYYKQYRKEFDRLPLENKKRIIDAYYNGLAYDMGYTLAATRFLENRGKATSYANKDSINKNTHQGRYITYDCGDYGINTRTYLRSIGKDTTNHQAQIKACKKLANDKELNLSMVLSVYDYALDRYNGNVLTSWNYYNTGKKQIINDRIYKMKGIIMVLQDEVKVDVKKSSRLARN